MSRPTDEEIAELEAERDAAIKRANLHQAMWREAEQDVVNLAEPLKYGDMLCFTRGTFNEKVKEMQDMRARITSLEAAMRVHEAEMVPSLTARIAELEAERDRLKVSLGEALAYRSEDHGPAKKPIR